MRKLICFFLLTAFGLHASATRTVTVFVRNQLDNARTDQPVVISLAQYGEVRTDRRFPANSTTSTRTTSSTNSVSWPIWARGSGSNTPSPSSTKASHAPTLPASMPTCWSGTPATRN